MTIKTWTDGETLTATDLNSNFTQKVTVPADTGWVTVNDTLANVTGSLQARRIGSQVWIRSGVFERTATDWGAVTNSSELISAIGTQFTPDVSRIFTCPSSATNGGVHFRIGIQSDGKVTLRPSVASSSLGVHIVVSYLVD